MPMTKKRCTWCGNDPLYVAYHDEEWGVPVYEDSLLFEFLVLETFQAGLSWITILRKRENFRKAFDQFNYSKIAAYDENKYNELLVNEGIIRNKLKIRATVSNARAFMEVQKEFGSFSNYLWKFVNHQPINNPITDLHSLPPYSDLSTTISKDLKKRGFAFVGTTVIYAFMQAVGLVNDHAEECYRNIELANLTK
jgi:DNA-3-methyladenine glycosylase I